VFDHADDIDRSERTPYVSRPPAARRGRQREARMRDSDLSAIKDRLAAIKREEARLLDGRRGRRQNGRLSEIRREAHRRRAQLSDFFTHEDEAFREGVSGRLKAYDLLATPVPPGKPINARLETPFLIWAFRNGVTVTILDEAHIEPLNSWAKFGTRWQHEGGIGPHDEVVFYFLWQNETSSDAVVNVESQLMMNGTCSAYAESRLIPLIGKAYLGLGVWDESKLSLDAELKLLEWWHQPATQPLRQPGQLRDVLDVGVSGGFTLAQWGARLGGESWTLSGSHHVYYDRFYIPADAVAIFEVSLRMQYSGDSGWSEVNFHDPTQAALVCPYVALTSPLLVTG
jgi:hypothetical protein